MKRVRLAVLGLSGQSIFLSVDHFHQNGETVHAHSLFHEPGGKGYNQAVAAARLGAQVAYLTAVGDDADGEECRSRLLEEGVAPVCARKQAHTAYAAILTDRAGENRVTVYPGASALLSGEDVRAFEAQIAAADFLILQNELPEDAFREAFALADRHGVPVSLNPAPYAPWCAPYLRRAYVVTPNLSEACALTGLDAPAEPLALAEALLRAGIPRAVVTLGGEGALVIADSRFDLVPAVPVRACDTTGAGDCFHAALTVALARGDSLLEAARFAARAAALSVTRPHVLTALPYAREVE